MLSNTKCARFMTNALKVSEKNVDNVRTCFKELHDFQQVQWRRTGSHSRLMSTGTAMKARVNKVSFFFVKERVMIFVRFHEFMKNRRNGDGQVVTRIDIYMASTIVSCPQESS